MKFLNENYWGTLPLPDFRSRFLIETFWELLSKNSPYCYQSRLMNVLSSASELVEALDEYEIDERSLSSLKNSIEEFNECWSKDLVVGDVYKSIVTSVSRVIKVTTSEKINHDTTRRLRFICNHILSKEKEYLETLLGKLKTVLLTDLELTHKERITSELYSLTSLFITLMMNKGYSPTYLFNRMEYFTRKKNYKGRNFQDQFTLIFDRLQSQEKRYLLCFGLQTSDKRPFLRESGIFSVTFSELPPDGITGEEISHLNKKSTIDLFAIIEIDATDYVSAAWKAKEVLARSFDFILYNQASITVKELDACLSYFRIADISHKRPVNISLLIEFMTSFYKPYRSSSPLTFGLSVGGVSP